MRRHLGPGCRALSKPAASVTMLLHRVGGDRRSTTISTPAPKPAEPVPPDEVLDAESPGWHGQPWPLMPGAPIGQTFRARHAGLCAVEVLLAVAAAGDGHLTCSLRRDGPDGPLVHTQTLPVAGLASERFARFVLPPLPDSAGQRFYFWLDVTAAGSAVYTTGLARLSDGTAYRRHEPVDGCLVFRTLALAPDARLAERRQVEALLAAHADVSRELVAARATIRRLTDEQASLHARLTALLARLTPTVPAGGEVTPRA